MHGTGATAMVAGVDFAIALMRQYFRRLSRTGFDMPIAESRRDALDISFAGDITITDI